MRNRTEAFLQGYREADIGEAYKNGTLLAAWGLYTPKTGKHMVPANKPSAMGYGSEAWAAVYDSAIGTRNDAEQWLLSNQSKALAVDFHRVPPEQWWRTLSRYKFLLSPIGTAIQCSRLVEALLMLTVPIVPRAGYRTHDDLRALGFPIVVIDQWSDITRGGLASWWTELSPRLQSFRESCLTAEGYW